MSTITLPKLLPQRHGQASVMTISCASDPDGGHWYSPAEVQKYIDEALHMNTMHNLFDDSDPNLIETEHLLFEANAMSAGFSIDRIPGSTYYCNLATQDRWRGWSARAALNNDLQKRKINK